MHGLNISRKMSSLGRLWWRGRLIDPVKENPINKMLKKYTKYVATAFAVASLSTFMIGCGGAEEDTGPLEYEDDPEEGGEGEEGG